MTWPPVEWLEHRHDPSCHGDRRCPHQPISTAVQTKGVRVMIATIASGGLKAVVCGLAAVAFAGLVLAAMIATPVGGPPELTSVSVTAHPVDRSHIAAI